MMIKQAELKQLAYASNLKSRALSVLIYLIDRSNKDLICFPAIPTMAEQLHISVSTVKRALKELIDAGYIRKEARFREKNRGQSSNLYTLIFVQSTAPDKENTSSETSGDCIEQSAVRESPVDCVIEHITFETLSSKEKSAEPEQKPQESAEQAEPVCVSRSRKCFPDACTSVHASVLRVSFLPVEKLS